MARKAPFTLNKPEIGGGDYTRFSDGDNRFRILTKIIEGYEVWSHLADTNEVHRQEAQFTDADLKKVGAEGERPKYFYACGIWNYDTERFEVWVITQKTLIKPIYDTIMDEDWGDPADYDIVITKTGSGKENTSYSFRAKPHSDFKAADPKEMKINLKNLFGGGDPFKV